MNLSTATERLRDWDRKGRYVFTRGDLRKIFHDDNASAFHSGLQRLVKTGTLTRAAHGVYVHSAAHSLDGHALEHVARALRRGEYNYISLESALSHHGVMSQAPVDRLTIMTTGRKGEYVTPWGTIEFTHTARPSHVILEGMRDTGGPLKMATPEVAWRDLKRAGRNTHLVNREELQRDD